VAAIGERLGVRPRVAVCVIPNFQVKGSGMRLGGGSQQFGVDAEQVPALLTRLAAMDLDVLGFHVFAGSQNLCADILAEAHGRTADLVVRLADEAPQPVRYVNLGGGLGIPYFQRDQALDLATIGDNLAAVMSERLRPPLPEARIVLELGRFLVGEAGGYVTESSTARSRAATPSSSSMAASTTSSLPRGTSGRSSARTTRSPSRTEWASRVLRPSASSGACAPRWTCSHVMSASRVPRSATLWRSFRPAPTGASHSVPRPSDTDGAVVVDRRPPGLHDR
jgi:arginine decarboxylase-like protein